jgi:hypothetical protein
MSTWRDAAERFIAEQREAHPELGRDELKKHCSKNYPFAHRRGWAYKAFLAAMRKQFGTRSKSMAAEKQGQAQLPL